MASNEIKAFASRRPDLLAYWLVAERLATDSIQRFLLIHNTVYTAKKLAKKARFFGTDYTVKFFVFPNDYELLRSATFWAVFVKLFLKCLGLN